VSDFVRDVRYTLRSLRRNPGFAAATILVLGIGVGAISLIFSTYNTVVLRPLPFPRPDELVWVWETTPSGSRNSLSYDDYVDFRDGADALASLAAVGVFSQGRLLTGSDGAQEVSGRDVSANLFATLGVSPALGRSFAPDDELRGEADVVVLSHGLWMRRYGGDPGVVGHTIIVDGQPVEVLGVMPRDFDFPQGTDMWSPLQRAAGYASGRGNNNFTAVGRLRASSTLDEAQVQMSGIAGRIAAAYPDSKAGWGVELQSLHDRYFGPAGNTILMLMGIIALVPLVACANVASLFTARALARRSELASRLTLGASRSRIFRQLLTESVVVALGGGAVGLALAYGGGVALRHLAPAALPRLDEIGIDANVMIFTLLAALLTVPFFGVLPALRSTDMDVAETLKSGGGRGASGRRAARRGGLVVAQVALSLMLVLASGLFLRSYLRLQDQDPGFDPEGVLYSRVALPAFKYASTAEMRVTWDELLDRVGSIPGVLSVGAVDYPPFSGRGPWNSVWAVQRPPASAADMEGATRRFVTPGLFRTLGIPVLAGRVWGREEEQAELPVTVINQAAAQRFFPGEDPVGQTLVLGGDMNLTVLGVVGDTKEQGLGDDAPASFYLPLWIWSHLTMQVVARVRDASPALVEAWRTAVHTVEPDVPEAPVRSMNDRLSTTLFQPRFRSALVAAFALVSLLLSAIGLYGVLAYFVREHGHELGVRLALGATGEQVARLVVTRGMSLVLWGVALGLVGGIGAGRLVQARGWMPDVDLADPAVYLASGLTLLVVALVTCIVPALRARRVAPADVMRVE
jgi:putative ABC transport system permease protein